MAKADARSGPKAATRRAAPAPRPRGRPLTLKTADLLDRFDRGEFPASVYLSGPSEPIKAAILAELKAAWLEHAPGAPPARVFRSGEFGVDEILAAYHGASLLYPRELLIVLDVEAMGRSEKKIVALAEGIARPSDTSCLFLLESASETPRKSLDPLKQACQAVVDAAPPGRADLLRWAQRRFKRERLEADAGVAEAIVDVSEGDALAFFNEIGKLVAFAGQAGRVTTEHVDALLKPALGAELPEYLLAVGRGESGLAARRLGSILSSGVAEGAALWALGNLVGGALGGWTRHKEACELLRRRSTPRGLARALDAVYRAEAAWKDGRADPVAVLEQATREVCAAR
jgi:DNA polymerase III delta subunit